MEAVAGGQVELLQARAGLRDDLQAGLGQEVAARQLQANQAETTGLHEAEGRNQGGETSILTSDNVIALLRDLLFSLHD